jgi:DNA-binding PadR family transcriptional regulator
MMSQLPKMRDRQVMQRLELGKWKLIWQLAVPAGERLLARLVDLGWIERREQDGRLQIRITPKGLEVLKVRLPDYTYQKRSR